jgi:hypothetical protein
MGRSRKGGVKRNPQTIYFNEDLYAQMKHIAVDRRCPVYEVFEEAVTQYLQKMQRQSIKPKGGS